VKKALAAATKVKKESVVKASAAATRAKKALAAETAEAVEFQPEHRQPGLIP
jgi:hypothetical protein